MAIPAYVWLPARWMSHRTCRLSLQRCRLAGRKVGRMAQTPVFVSYSRKQFYTAEYLARILGQHGLSAWLDVEEILPGDDWQASIDQGLAACQALVLVASRAAYRSTAVQYEVAAARAAGKPIYVAVIEDNPFVAELRTVATVIDCRSKFSSSVTAIAQALQTGKRPQATYRRSNPLGWRMPFGRVKYLQLILLNMCFLLGTGAILLRKQVVIHGPLNPRLLPYLVLATIPVVLWGLSFAYSLLLLVAFRRQGRITYLELELWPALHIFAFPALFGFCLFSTATQSPGVGPASGFGPYFNASLAITDRAAGDPTSLWQLLLLFSAWAVYLAFVSCTSRGWLLASGWLLLIPVLQSPLVPSLVRPLALLTVGAGIAFLGMCTFLNGHDVPIAFGEQVLEYHLPESMVKVWKPVTRSKVSRINQDRAWGRWLTPGAFPNEAFMRVYQHARDPQPASAVGKTWRLYYVPADAGSAEDIRRVFAEYPALHETASEQSDVQIALLSNKTPRQWIDTLATRYPRLICIIISSFEFSALDKALQQHQWLDYRQQRPYQIHNLAKALTGSASTVNPTTPENFLRPVGPYPVKLVVHALRLGGAACVVLGSAAQFITTTDRVAVVPLPLIVTSIMLGVWAWWEAGRLLARNALLFEMVLTFSAVLIALGYWIMSGAATMLLPREIWVRNGYYNGALTTGLAFVASFAVVPFLFYLLVATFELARGSSIIRRWLPRYTRPTWQRTLAVASWRRLDFASIFYVVAAFVLVATVVVDSPYRYQQVREYDVPNVNSFTGALLAGADGNIWFLSSPGSYGTLYGIGYISPTGHMHPEQIDVVEPVDCRTHPSFARECFEVSGLRFGPDHQLWYVVEQQFPPYTPEIRRSTLGGATIRFPLPTHSTDDSIITAFAFDSMGKLWYTRAEVSLHSERAGWIGRLDPTDPAGSIIEFELPANGSPTSIVSGPDGNMWFFPDGVQHAIGKITPQGAITEYPVPYESSLAGWGQKELIVGPDHKLWFTDPQSGVIGSATMSGVITLYASGGGSFPTHLVAAPDGGLWFLDKGKIAIGHIAPGGQLRLYPLHALIGPRASLAADADGNLWVTLYNQVGRMTPEGALTFYDVPTLDADLGSIMTGPDHHVWFVEYPGLIGELRL